MDKPDWKHWQQMGSAALWEAVALSCNVEPRALRHLTQTEFRRVMTDGSLGDRLSSAKGATTSGAIKVITAYSHDSQRHKCIVDLRTFATWATSQGWRLSRRFPRTDPSNPSAPNAKGWPWGDHETELLRNLASAAKEWWSTYDPSNPRTAPKNAEVSGWLTTKHKTPKRVAEIMAQILRADGLPTGPRR